MRLAAIVFTLLSSAALADPSQHRATAVPMSEAELDEITAGAVTTLSIILTPGNGGNPDITTSTNHSGGNRIQCHNCTLFGGGLEQGPAQGARLMINNNHPERVKVHCFGGITFLGC